MNKNLLMYMHAGSRNHGCEAIIRGLRQALKDCDFTILSYKANEDYDCNLNEAGKLIQIRNAYTKLIPHIYFYIKKKLTKTNISMLKYNYKPAGNLKNFDLAISIGGDNYCYEDMLGDLSDANQLFEKEGIKTILLGCSIEPELIERDDIKKDLSRYKAIIAREGITYNALKNTFNNEGPSIYNIPDPAFLMNPKEDKIPSNLQCGNVVGINISPMIQKNEKNEGITLEAYKELVSYILENTDMQIAFIPHVTWSNNDDREAINNLKGLFDEKIYGNRFIIIEDMGAEYLKGIIKNCRFFIGARTHSTIAAYSESVPTIVIGYSVKARGIGQDLFSKYGLNNLVIPVQELSDGNEIKKAFIWLMDNESEIKSHLNNIMPEYKKKAFDLRKCIEELMV